jgi:hypothetical protein
MIVYTPKLTIKEHTKIKVTTINRTHKKSIVLKS